MNKIITIDGDEYKREIPLKDSIYQLKGHELNFYSGGPAENTIILEIPPEKDKMYITSMRKTNYEPNRKMMKELDQIYNEDGKVKVIIDISKDRIIYDMLNNNELSSFTLAPPVIKSGERFLASSFKFDGENNPISSIVMFTKNYENLALVKFFEAVSRRFINTSSPLNDFGCRVIAKTYAEQYGIDNSIYTSTRITDYANPIVSPEKIYEYESNEFIKFILDNSIDKNPENNTIALSQIMDEPRKLDSIKEKISIDINVNLTNLPGDFPKLLRAHVINHLVYFIVENEYDYNKYSYELLCDTMEKATGIENSIVVSEAVDERISQARENSIVPWKDGEINYE